jgi:hypothetical protein
VKEKALRVPLRRGRSRWNGVSVDQGSNAMSVRTDIMRTLGSPHCRHINFTLGGGTVQVQGSRYATIARRIASRQIQIVQSSRVPSTSAGYNKTLNCFIVGTAPSRRVIVHEATHAINDWRRVRISDVADECCAYIAEMVFTLAEDPGLRASIRGSRDQFIQRLGQFMQQCRIDPGLCNATAIGEATLIALDILAQRPVSAGTYRALREALDRDPQTHRDPATTVRAYDGLSRTTIPADFLREFSGTVIHD